MLTCDCRVQSPTHVSLALSYAEQQESEAKRSSVMLSAHIFYPADLKSDLRQQSVFPGSQIDIEIITKKLGYVL